VEGVGGGAAGFGDGLKTVGVVVAVGGELGRVAAGGAVGLVLLFAVAVEVVGVAVAGDGAAGFFVDDGFQASAVVVGLAGEGTVGPGDQARAAGVCSCWVVPRPGVKTRMFWFRSL
ncbi:hypothetical protein, partial [Tahibacter aquaticus]|uniref:hypothetical protein n=1 Tax=Tahibacter aquaticus TaxID=520092 RepID=UPI001AAC5F0E